MYIYTHIYIHMCMYMCAHACAYVCMQYVLYDEPGNVKLGYELSRQAFAEHIQPKTSIYMFGCPAGLPGAGVLQHRARQEHAEGQ